MRFRKIISGLATGLVVTSAWSWSVTAHAKAPVSSAKVVAAIKKGVDYLLAHQKPNKFWEQGAFAGLIPPNGDYSQKLGESALVIEALLDVEQSLKLPKIYMFNSPMKQALRFIVDHRHESTYAASFQANALALLPRRRIYRLPLAWDENYLLHSMHQGGGYSYGWGNAVADRAFPNIARFWDNSNSQYGVLGMWAVAHTGIAVPARYWLLAANHWRMSQFINGTWGYKGFARRPGPNVRPPPARAATFTPAGVASLLICDEFLGSQNVGTRPVVDSNVVAGLHWINRHFAPAETDQYTMYCYERVGLASGLQYFGKHNWYNDYARTLIRQQLPDGSWGPNFINNGGTYAGTAYALLILDRGFNPIFMNKLQYGKGFYGPWNARQRDVANVTSWVSNTAEAPLNWQVVNFNSPVSSWLNSPIVTITGSGDPMFSRQDIAELRAYINAGGMVFCSSDGGSFTFRVAMMKYGREVVNNKYEFHRLTQKSLLLTIQPWYKIHLNMLAISNGIRDLWVISPNDMGAVWERRAFSEKKYWEFPMNLYLYATGKGYLADRLHSLVITPPAVAPTRAIGVGQLKYNGNWNPEPGAWPRFNLLLQNQARTRIKLTMVTTDQLNAHTTPLLDMTGTGKFTLTDAQIAALRAYLHQGGMLFADAAGGNQNFTDAFTNLAVQLYPKAVMAKLPAKSSIYTGTMPGGTNATKLRYRRYYIDKNGVKRTPEFLGIKAAERWVIVFSPDDVASGFLGTNTWGISGYTPKSAVALGTNVVEYAARHAPH
ncbi:MAG: DUF4159 domain-containing protein [Phycisphaerae bacterium]